jgi:hypothetical protein
MDPACVGGDRVGLAHKQLFFPPPVPLSRAIHVASAVHHRDQLRFHSFLYKEIKMRQAASVLFLDSFMAGAGDQSAINLWFLFHSNAWLFSL